MAIEVDLQRVVNKYAISLEGPRQLYNLYPDPRPVGPPKKELRPLPAAISLSVIGAFEGFAEDLVAATLYKLGYGWAHIAHHANLTNPSIRELRDRLDFIGIAVDPVPGWTTPLPKQSSVTGWNTSFPVTWADVLTRSDGWIQVRHCLTHGLVRGIGPELWPGPLDKRSAKTQQQKGALPAASDVLAKTSYTDKRALHLWSSVECSRIYSVGSATIAEGVANYFGDTIDTSTLRKFDNV